MCKLCGIWIQDCITTDHFQSLQLPKHFKAISASITFPPPFFLPQPSSPSWSSNGNKSANLAMSPLGHIPEIAEGHTIALITPFDMSSHFFITYWRGVQHLRPFRHTQCHTPICVTQKVGHLKAVINADMHGDIVHNYTNAKKIPFSISLLVIERKT